MNNQTVTPIVFVLLALVLVIAIQAMSVLAASKDKSEEKNALTGFLMLGLIALVIAGVVQGIYILDATHSSSPSPVENQSTSSVWHQYIQLTLSFLGGLGGGALALLKFGHDVRKLNVETGVAMTKLSTETTLSITKLNRETDLAILKTWNDGELARQRIQADTSIASQRMQADTRIAFLSSLISDDSYRVNINEFLRAVKTSNAKKLKDNLEGPAFFFLFVLKPGLKAKFISAINRENIDVNELQNLTENLFSV